MCWKEREHDSLQRPRMHAHACSPARTTPPLQQAGHCATLLPWPLQADVDEFLFPEPRMLLERLSASTGPRFAALNMAVGQLLEEFSLVSFVPLDITDEERWGLL